jgi:hypothetical protein
MVWAHSDKTAIVGVGATPYFPRGQSLPRTIYEPIGDSILAACDDAGLTVRDIDGFAYYSGARAGCVDSTATVYSFAICRRSPFPDVADYFLYAPIVVDLDGAPGARLVSNLVGLEPRNIAIGMPVRVDWNPLNDGWLLPMFRSEVRS